jgi:hypothetical protein
VAGIARDSLRMDQQAFVGNHIQRGGVASHARVGQYQATPRRQGRTGCLVTLLAAVEYFYVPRAI